MMRRIQRIQQSAAYQRRMGRKGENSPKNSNTVIDDWSFQQFLQSTNYGESLSIHSPAAPERAAAAGGVFWPCRARTPGFDGMHDAWCRREAWKGGVRRVPAGICRPYPTPGTHRSPSAASLTDRW